jgi:hypothetical protein
VRVGERTHEQPGPEEQLTEPCGEEAHSGRRMSHAPGRVNSIAARPPDVRGANPGPGPGSCGGPAGSR